jgi:signal transduction histidine kinase
LRRKYFFIVFAFLLATILVVSTSQVIFFESERLRLVDQRLETIASSLIASGLSLSMIENLESTDDLINDLLGEEHVDHIINVYSLSGEILAQNYTATEIPLRFDSVDVHESYDVAGQKVRVLNIKHGRLLVQVGVLLNPDILSRFIVFNKRFVGFTGFIFLLLTIAAYFSSVVLFRPLRRLTLELQSMSRQLEHRLGQPLSGFVIGSELAGFSRGHRNTKDEFELLCMEMEAFLKKLGEYTRSFNAQSAILTHELKTPLTILRNYLEEVRQAGDLARAKTLGQAAMHEIDRLTRLINDFLQWSVLTSNPGQPDEIYAVKLSEAVSKTAADLNSLHGGRVRLEIDGASVVFALPDHVRQLVSNLLSNALNYSRKEVICSLRGNLLEVRDYGPGIPEDVRQHLGSPFNRGSRSREMGSGLGLAWVHSLCEKYGWRLTLDSSPTGTSVRVAFS